jgi:hypothetical protein
MAVVKWIQGEEVRGISKNCIARLFRLTVLSKFDGLVLGVTLILLKISSAFCMARLNHQEAILRIFPTNCEYGLVPGCAPTIEGRNHDAFS